MSIDQKKIDVAMKVTFFLPATLLASFLSWGYPSPAQAQDRQLLMNAVESHALQQAELQFPMAQSIDISHRSNQSLNHLTPCQDWQLTNENQHWLGNIRIRVQCQTPSNWQLFWPIQINVEQNIVVLRQPAGRGEPLTAEQLGLQPANLAQQRQGYFSEIEPLIGARLSRNGQTGATINPRMVSLASLVSRGDELDIILRSPGIELKARGRALANGQAGEQIDFQNLATEQRVRARILNADTAVIEMQ